LEVSRLYAQALEGLGRHQEAVALLLALEPTLIHFRYAMDVHYHLVVSLLQKLMRREDLQAYCKAISSKCDIESALYHLDWILIFAESSDDQEPTEFMRAVLLLCAAALGMEAPPSNPKGEAFRYTVGLYCLARDQANRRFEAFRLERMDLVANSSSETVLNEHVKLYFQTEATPFFRKIARELVT